MKGESLCSRLTYLPHSNWTVGDDVSDPLQGTVRDSTSNTWREIALDPGPIQSDSELDHSSLVHGTLLPCCLLTMYMES